MIADASISSSPSAAPALVSDFAEESRVRVYGVPDQSPTSSPD
jgi:hypothetical protein